MLAVSLLAAVSHSIQCPNTPVRVVVPSVRSAVELLAEHDPNSTIHWCGDQRRADVYGDGWHVEIVAGDSDKILSRIRNRPTVFLPLDDLLLATRSALRSALAGNRSLR